MSAILAAIALQTAMAPVQPADSAHIKCAFNTADRLATSTSDSPDIVADKVIAECTAETKAGPPSEFTLFRMRTAAVAMVNRRRGTDGQPADAPIMLPQRSEQATERVMGSVEIPDDIAPALLPYMMCQAASSGIPVFADNKRVPPPPGMTRGSDCSAIRAKAAKEADRMLKQAGGRKRAERAAYVEKVLVAVDEQHAASIARQPAQMESTD